MNFEKWAVFGASFALVATATQAFATDEKALMVFCSGTMLMQMTNAKASDVAKS